VLAISSGGGHWVQLRRLAPAFEGCDLTYATVDTSVAESVSPASVYGFPDANKDQKIRLIWSALVIAWILFRVRPDVIISTGAAGGFLAIAIGRLFKIKGLFVDSIANAKELSVSAKMALPIANEVYTQWPEVAQKQNAKFRGSVL